QASGRHGGREDRTGSGRYSSISPRPSPTSCPGKPCSSTAGTRWRRSASRFARIRVMIAAVLRAPRRLAMESRAHLEPRADEAVVRVTGAGLCGTDYRIWSGDRAVQYPRVMGHELIGTVLRVGPGVEGLAIGAKIAVEPTYSCGECPLCREGNRNLCLKRTAVGIDVDGGFAEEVSVPARCCWTAPRGIPDDQLLLAEPLAVVVRAVRRGQPKAG